MVDDAKPLVVYKGGLQGSAPEKSIVRLDNLIMQAIKSLKEPGGSNKTTIVSYIEEQYWAPPNFRRKLLSKLKFLKASGKLIKVERRYRIAPTSYFDKERNSSMLSSKGKQRIDIDVLTKFQIDMEWVKFNPAEVAARAFAQAEAAILEAEAAAAEAEVVEMEAEAAQHFAEAALKKFKRVKQF